MRRERGRVIRPDAPRSIRKCFRELGEWLANWTGKKTGERERCVDWVAKKRALSRERPLVGLLRTLDRAVIGRTRLPRAAADEGSTEERERLCPLDDHRLGSGPIGLCLVSRAAPHVSLSRRPSASDISAKR